MLQLLVKYHFIFDSLMQSKVQTLVGLVEEQLENVVFLLNDVASIKFLEALGLCSFVLPLENLIDQIGMVFIMNVKWMFDLN